MTNTYATRTRKANAYAGSCSKCSGHVAAQVGYLGPKVSGRWTVEHTECPSTAAVEASPTTGDDMILTTAGEVTRTEYYAALRLHAPKRGRVTDCDNGHYYYQASCFCCRNQIGL
jgi:hypothetical protein